MRLSMSRFLLLLLGICLTTNMALAGEFDPLFRVSKLNGICLAKAPGEADYSPAVVGKAYPYGTKIKTGKKSSMIVQMSRGNTFRVLANAALAVTKDPKNRKLRKVKLDEGKIEVELEKNIKAAYGNEFHVETATAVCAAVGTIFEVESRTEHDLKIVVILCKEGEIKVFGDHFEIPSMGPNSWVSLSSSRDRNFVRIKNGQGRYQLNYKDSDGNPQTRNFEMGSIVKIWQRDSDSGDSVIVTILITSKDEEVQEAHTYAEALPEPEDAGEDKLPPEEVILQSDEDPGEDGDQDTGSGEEGDPGRDVDEEGWEIITTTTTTSTSTTTTTLPPQDEVTTTTTTTSTTQPSPTPVGKR